MSGATDMAESVGDGSNCTFVPGSSTEILGFASSVDQRKSNQLSTLKLLNSLSVNKSSSNLISR